jgi:hypothetical protein
MAKRLKARHALLAAAVTGAVLLTSPHGHVRAQDASQEDTVVKLAGKRLRVDKSGRLRAISQQEAREMVATLTAMTTTTVVNTTAAADRGEFVQLSGFDHVVVGRPNGDGTTEVRCVSSVEEAVSFFSQQSADGEQE